MRPLTIQDLLAYRKCPRSMMLRRLDASNAQTADRAPLCSEAAAALYANEAGEILFHKTIRKNHCIAAADLLISHADGWELVLDTNSLHVREAHVWEAAFCAYVLESAGFPVRRVTALLISPDYVRGEQIDWNALYIRQDVTERALSHINGVRNHIAQMKELAMSEQIPQRDLFESCLKPRECPYWALCSKDLPAPNVFSIVGMSNRRKFQLYRKGIVRFEDCLKYAKLPKPQKQQVLFELEKRPADVNIQALERFLKGLWYPICCLDFESYQPPIPPFKGMKPFTQCAFLYSVHIIENRDAQPEHRQAFAPHGTDPRRLIAESLCRDIPKNACVAVYSSGLEKSVVRSLAQMFPDLREHLLQICANMRDLLGLFRDRVYYDRRMEGSCSLKHVLPAIDEGLSYEALGSVQNGEEAMHVYERMDGMTAKQRAAMEKQLCEYCAMDTLAIVRILQTLECAVQERNP